MGSAASRKRGDTWSHSTFDAIERIEVDAAVERCIGPSIEYIGGWVDARVRLPSGPDDTVRRAGGGEQ
jgi:hypothetical protein